MRLFVSVCSVALVVDLGLGREHLHVGGLQQSNELHRLSGHPMLDTIRDHRYQVHQLDFSEFDVDRHVNGRQLAVDGLRLSVSMFGEPVVLDLSKNNRLFHPDYEHVIVGEDGTHQVVEEDVNCLFSGVVQGRNDSSVFLSLCETFQDHRQVAGVVKLNHTHVYNLQPSPLDAQGKWKEHLLFDTRDVINEGTCGNHGDEHSVTDGFHHHFHGNHTDGHGHHHHHTDDEARHHGHHHQTDDHHHDHHHQTDDHHQHHHHDRHHQTDDHDHPTHRSLASSVKFVKMVIVNDHERYQGLRSSTHSHSAAILNQVQALYNDLNNMRESNYELQIQIVKMLTHSYGDPYAGSFTIDSDGSADSTSLHRVFDDYTASPSNLGGLVMGSDYTVAHLLTGYDLIGNTVGVAYVGGSCRPRQSSGVNQASLASSNNLISTTVAHELAHNLGVEHTNNYKDGTLVSSPCISDQDGFLMDPSGAGETAWSTCTPNWITMYFEGFPRGCTTNCAVRPLYGIGERCMEDQLNNPVGGFPICGDGLREADEQCDCGSDDCKDLDPCCDGSTCRFKPGATCSLADGCCDPDTCNVVAKEENLVCREGRGACDIPETCNGVSSMCPTDSYLLPGTSCTDPQLGEGSCYAGECKTSFEACSRYSGRGIFPVFVPGVCSPDNECMSLLCKEASGTCWALEGSDGSRLRVEDGTPCGVGNMCYQGQCVEPSQVRNPTTSLCENGVKDPGETDVDCGGTCFPCPNGSDCFADSDCYSLPGNVAVCDLPNLPEDESSNAPTPPLVPSPAPTTTGGGTPTDNPATAGPGTRELPLDKTCAEFGDVTECNSFIECIHDDGMCKFLGRPTGGCNTKTKSRKCERYAGCAWNRLAERENRCYEVDMPERSLLAAPETLLPSAGLLVKGQCRSTFTSSGVSEEKSDSSWFETAGDWIVENPTVSIPLIGVACTVLIASCVYAGCCKCLRCRKKNKGANTKPQQQQRRSTTTTSSGVPGSSAGPVNRTISQSAGISMAQTARVPTSTANQRMIRPERCISCFENYGNSRNGGLCNACVQRRTPITAVHASTVDVEIEAVPVTEDSSGACRL